MTEQKTLEQRVNEDLASDSPPLSNQEYLDYLMNNCIHYYYEISGGLRTPHRYDGKREISEDEYKRRALSGESIFPIEPNEKGEFKLYLNNMHYNMKRDKSKQLNKFRVFLRKKYPNLFTHYINADEFANGEIGKINEDYSVKIFLILEGYNKKVPKRDRVLKIWI